MRRWLTIITLAALLVLATACNEPAGSPTPTPPQAATEQASSDATSPGEESAYPPPAVNGYPAPGAPSDSSYPPPEEVGPTASAVLEVVPEPSSNEVGTVTGILILETDQPVPVSEELLYLGSVVQLDDGRPGMSSLDKSTAPKTGTNQVGQFIFENVPAGQYTLILDLITTSFLLNTPEGGDLIITVQGGEIVDLGELRYDALPVEVGE